MHILTICASLGQRSANNALLTALERSAPNDVRLERYERLAELPYFNPELQGDEPSDALTEWRRRTGAADAIVIATPEYAHSLPGVLKNALDWLVGSGELVNKPVLLISASTSPTGGVRGTIALTTTLLAMAAEIVATVNVAGVAAKLAPDRNLTHEPTIRRLRETLHALIEAAEARS